MILSRCDEIVNIFRFFLNDECIRYILKIESSENYKESLEYWIYNYLNNKRVYIYSKNDIVINLHSQIIRMNGDLEKIKEENEQIKLLEEQNKLWADAWMRGTRF
jgi:hypothetical protein|tara:strand:- start:150 stop:464 length:315 start_codon:yes stop_codon:yes gene_type:complete